MDTSFQIALQEIILHKLCGDIYEFGVYNGGSERMWPKVQQISGGCSRLLRGVAWRGSRVLESPP